MARAECERCGNEIADTEGPGTRDGWRHIDYPNGCPNLDAYTFEVTVEAPNHSDAERVMIERLDPDEDYGFDYQVAWAYVGQVQTEMS